MEGTDEAGKPRRLRTQTLIMILVLAASIVTAGWTLATVSTFSHVPRSDFVALPTTPLSEKGAKVMFVGVSAIAEKGVAVGLKGYLRTTDGKPVVGATIYMTYYLRSAYRTQGAVTDSNGFFEARFPMNWTGWLPITLTYFGDEQHQGLTQVFSVPGENL